MILQKNVWHYCKLVTALTFVFSAVLLTAIAIPENARAADHDGSPLPLRDADKTGTRIIAHRGASRDAPENTVASTVLGYKQKADISEIDVYLSKDNRIMVIHDTNTERTAGVKLSVENSNSSELRKLDVGTFKSEKYAGEKIPFIEEIFAVVPQDRKLFIEIKCSPKIAPYLKKAIENSGKTEQMEIISFSLDVLIECKKFMPGVRSYYLRSSKKDKDTGQFLPYDTKIIEQAVAAGLDGVNLNYQGLTKEFVEEAHKAGLKVFVWTVDDIEAAKQLCKYKVDGITTNMPGIMRMELFPDHIEKK